MNKSRLSKMLAAFIAITATAMIGGLVSTGCSGEPPSGTAPQTGTTPAAINSVATKTEITGAELYSINCNRCHQERYPTERTGAQWKTIMLHMQVRANIPVSQAKLILQYLQDNSGR